MWTDSDSDEKGHDDDYAASDDDYDASDESVWDLDDSRAYWRRRFFILCGGVVALGLCAWLFPGAHQAPARTSTASASMAAKRQSLPPAAYGSAWPGPSPAGPTARPSTSPGASPTAPAKLATTQKKTKQKKIKKLKAGTAYHPRPTGYGSGGTATASRCAPASIVLSLFTSQPSYGQDASPEFSVYAVSTSAAACTLTYGPGAVRVVVTRHGHVVWDSASCKPRAAKPERFTLGVPQVLTMAWNRKAEGPAGCAGVLPAGDWGTFRVVATSHGQSSPVRAFKLAK
jgi:hypothetical protein